MTDILLSHFPSKFDYKVYVEGFGGGASLLFAKEPDRIEVYNDLDKNVYSLFKVLSDPDKFSRFKEKLDLTPYSRDLWEEYKKDLRGDLDMEDRAYKFFYVNRTSFNGIGSFAVTQSTSRRNMMKNVSDYLSTVDRLEDYHQRVSRVCIENRDIFDLLDKYDSPSSFVYLDPPYVQETRKSNQKYLQEFTDDQHKKLVDYCRNMKGKVLISGYDHPIYEGLKGFQKIQFPSPNANWKTSKSNAIETLWKNY